MEIFSHLLPKNSAIKLIGVLSYKYWLITVGAKKATGLDEQLVSPRKTNAQKTLNIFDPHKFFQSKPKDAKQDPDQLARVLLHMISKCVSLMVRCLKLIF